MLYRLNQFNKYNKEFKNWFQLQLMYLSYQFFHRPRERERDCYKIKYYYKLSLYLQSNFVTQCKVNEK